MVKRVIISVIFILIVLGAIGGTKGLQIGRMIAQGEQFTPPPVTVTTAVTDNTTWEQSVSSVGTLSAFQGVMVTAALSGKIVDIRFEPGSHVAAGHLLVQQDTSSEKAQLRAAMAAADVAKLSLERAQKLFAEKTIARSELDNAEAQYKRAISQADDIRTVIAKKTIRAPFNGRLGIRLVDPGQFVHAGDTIVSLQSLDPIHVDFSLPQHEAMRIKTGFKVRLSGDALSERQIEGAITASDPQVDSQTRTIKMQATVDNPDESLLPGMFVDVDVIMPDKEAVTVVPATSVLYAPYGDSVFVVEEKKSEATGELQKVLRQQLVRLGEQRGDFVSLLAGLEGSETIVSSGVFMLRNGQAVIENNSLAPEFNLNPAPADS